MVRAGLLCAGMFLFTGAAHAQDPAAQESYPDLPSEASARESLREDLRAYQQRIAELELRGGAYAENLSEQLLALGLAMQRNGDHVQAIDVFRRGVHLARINEGLYSTNQIALLQGEIASHIAIGSLLEADERQRYLHRVQQRTLTDATQAQALMQHALWQRRAYEAGLGEEPFARLVRMGAFYRVAVSQLAETEGEASFELLPPLYGMMQTQYMLSGFVGETVSGTYRTRGVFTQEESQQAAFRNQAFKQGQGILQVIFNVRAALPDAGLEELLRIKMMLGDWQMWHGKRGDAMETYAAIYRELEASEDAQELREQLFGTPQPLPSLDGVRAFPEPEQDENGRLLLEFGITERGRVVDLERLDTYEVNDEKAERIMRRFRQTLFRPRFDDGMPVETKGLRWAYDTSNW